MQHRVIASPVLAGLVALGLLASAGAQATMYRYTDENGQLGIGTIFLLLFAIKQLP